MCPIRFGGAERTVSVYKQVAIQQIGFLNAHPAPPLLTEQWMSMSESLTQKIYTSQLSLSVTELSQACYRRFTLLDLQSKL